MNLFRLLILSSLILLTGCVTTSNMPAEEKRQTILTMKNEVLTELYKLKPDTRQQVTSAAGYAVFSNANIKVIVASVGGGYGVARNLKSGKHTYMNMGEVGLGFGLGAKDFRAVFVFHSEEAYQRFIKHGWTFGGQADAAAKASEKGAAVSAEAVLDNVTIYQITKTGLALQATLKGTKYWVNQELN